MTQCTPTRTISRRWPLFDATRDVDSEQREQRGGERAAQQPEHDLDRRELRTIGHFNTVGVHQL
jgi:hypothetical protein